MTHELDPQEHALVKFDKQNTFISRKYISTKQLQNINYFVQASAC